MRTKFAFLVLFTLIFSCEELITVTFVEESLEFNDNATIEINIPKAEGNSLAKNAINQTIESHIANMLNFSEEESDSISLEGAVTKFDTEYAAFKSDFEESSLVWEAMFDGEVTYQSPDVITIAINSYLNTGGAHGNMNITLFNFDPMSGNLLTLEDILLDISAFETIARDHFKKATKIEEEGFGEYFFGDDFHLPANIGFNDEGVFLFYNIYEIASYAMGITEFTIPFDEVDALLNVL